MYVLEKEKWKLLLEKKYISHNIQIKIDVEILSKKNIDARIKN